MRDVPAWALSTPLLRALGGVHAQIQRQALDRVVLASQAGFELVQDREAGVHEWRDTEEVVSGEALLGFTAPGAGSSPMEALRDPEATLVAVERFGGTCRHPPSLELHPRLPLAVSHAWFGGEAHVERGLACSC